MAPVTTEKYVITMHNKDSPDYYASMYHAVIGTDTIICKRKDEALTVIKKYIENYPNLQWIRVECPGDRVCYWNPTFDFLPAL